MYYEIFILISFVIPSIDFFILSSEGSETNEIISKGRAQYQLLRERGNLPKYGLCWKSALETVEDGCRELSEETQSEIALALTNCFLEMSGLDVYHCDSDKKQNVRRICISSMTDRAFNVYTEFYTHTINMCWFLRGQIWQETISENTAKVGKQLETSAIKQEKLLEIQRESLEVQEHMLRHSRLIENILSDLSEATQSHKEMLILIGQTVSNLQSWLVGEVSWVNTLIFYVSFGILVMILTSTPRTMITRLPVLILLVISIFTERIICTFILNSQDFKKSASDLYGDINDCIQLLRYFFVILSFSIVIYKAYFHEDILISSKYILDNIYKQNQIILEKFEKNNLSLPDTAYLVYKTNFTHKENNRVRNSRGQMEENSLEKLNKDKSCRSNSVISCISSRVTPTNDYQYNLRSRQNTPN